MEGKLLDQLCGKHYDLPIFENDLVRVESAGGVIRVAIKGDDGVAFSWWEPTHPFIVRYVDCGKQGKWYFEVEARTPDQTKAFFSNGSEKHILTLTCTNSNVHPKPINVDWE